MTGDHHIDSRGDRVNLVVADYLEAERSGRPLDRDELLRQHADLADELCSFFTDREQFRQLAEPLGARPQSRL